jgi:hypothetical protein
VVPGVCVLCGAPVDVGCVLELRLSRILPADAAVPLRRPVHMCVGALQMGVLVGVGVLLGDLVLALP